MTYKTPKLKEGFIPCDWNEGNLLIDPSKIRIENPSTYLRELDDIENNIRLKFKLEDFLLKFFPGSDISIFTIFSLMSKSHDTIYLIREDYKQAAFFAEIFFKDVIYIDDLQEEISLIPNGGLIYFSNPGNPNCKYYNSKHLSKLIPQHLNCIVDLAYADFYEDFDLQDFHSHSQIFFIKTFSKFYGLAGLRTGIIIFKSNDLDLTRSLEAVNPKWIGSSQVASLKIALEIDENQIRINFNHKLNRLRNYLENEFGKNCEILHAGNFFRLDFTHSKYKNDFLLKMSNLKISVRDLSHIESLKNSTRINFRNELIDYLHI